MFAKFEVCTVLLATVRRNLAKVFFFEKPVLVFAAHPSNFAQTLTTKLQRSSRSRIFEFATQIFFITTQRQIFIKKNLPLKNFEKF